MGRKLFSKLPKNVRFENELLIVYLSQKYGTEGNVCTWFYIMPSMSRKECISRLCLGQ